MPTQLLFNIKADGTFKVRIVVRGDLTTAGEHYLETKSSMVSLDTVRMIVALAAGSDMILLSTDFSQAFLNAMLDDPIPYCTLPELPPEMRVVTLVLVAKPEQDMCIRHGAACLKLLAASNNI